MDNEKYEATDRGYKAMAHILKNTANSDIRNRGFSFFYDAERRTINLKAFNKTYCSSSDALIRIAFNLFNGYVQWSEEETIRYDFNSMLSILDDSNLSLVLKALEIRYKAEIHMAVN